MSHANQFLYLPGLQARFLLIFESPNKKLQVANLLCERDVSKNAFVIVSTIITILVPINQFISSN